MVLFYFRDDTFQKQSLHWTWLVIRPENGCVSTETEGMLVNDIAHRDFHDLKRLEQSPLLWMHRDKDLARIIPGLHEFGDILGMDEVEVIIWLLQFLSKPFGLSELFFTDAMSLQEALLRFRVSPVALISGLIIGLGGSASDKQPFWNHH